jgi:predicted transcriptional regulator of viral defense system
MANINTKTAISLFKERGGILRSSEAFALGINSKTLYSMRDKGYIEAVNRGIYRLTDPMIETSYIDLITVVKHLPKAVVCLISALAFHELTTQIPHFVYVAYQQGWRQPKLNYPPVKVFRYSKASFESGIEYHIFNGVEIPIYSPAKTVVDCFKFRNRVGLDVAIEALKELWHKNPQTTVSDLLKFAQACRVVNIITPYIEAITHE